LNYAREKDMKIKLVVQAYKTPEGNVSCFVLPKFIDRDNKLYSVDDVFNGVITKTSFSDLQFFVGKGAGAYPTASAVLSNISALSYNYRYEYKKLNAFEAFSDDENTLLKVFLRHKLAKSPEFKKYFQSIEECYFNQHSGYIIGVISLKNLKEIRLRNIADLLIILIKTIN
jgi:homoserine dehydrogenase